MKETEFLKDRTNPLSAEWKEFDDGLTEENWKPRYSKLELACYRLTMKQLGVYDGKLKYAPALNVGYAKNILSNHASNVSSLHWLKQVASAIDNGSFFVEPEDLTKLTQVMARYHKECKTVEKWIGELEPKTGKKKEYKQPERIGV